MLALHGHTVYCDFVGLNVDYRELIISSAISLTEKLDMLALHGHTVLFS